MLNCIQLNFFVLKVIVLRQHFQAVSSGKPQTSLTLFTIGIFILSMVCKNTSAADDPSAVGLTNFAFASYLGTGFYTSSGQDVFVLQLPLDYTIKQKTDTDSGILLKLPITIGFINFSGLEVEELPEIKDVTTLTFLPGIEYQIPVTPDWTLAPFADYGFARDFNYEENILIIGLGIKSYLDFHLDDSMFTLGNRFLYARERTKNSNNDADYSLIETGLNYRLDTDYLFENGPLYSNFYYINFYYPNNLVLLEQTENPVRVGMEHELGITISNLSDFLFFEKPQIGLGVRFGNGVNIYRIIFGAPF